MRKRVKSYQKEYATFVQKNYKKGVKEKIKQPIYITSKQRMLLSGKF